MIFRARGEINRLWITRGGRAAPSTPVFHWSAVDGVVIEHTIKTVIR